MTGSAPASVDPLFLGYVAVFGIAAVACFASIARARTIQDAEARRGLVWLLAMSGGWATAHVAFLVVPTPRLKTGAYMIGLIVGFATVGPWLYFCSAYTGRTLHRNATVRWAAIAVFLAVTAVKLTNPLHGLYFTAAPATEPFAHLSVHNGPFHWLAMGLAYALATVGYFMLVELFWQVGQDTTPLLGLVALTGIPIVFDVIGATSPFLLDITYEPLGVAAFAVGVVFLYFVDFQAIQLAGERDGPVIVLDDDDRVRDYNTEAADLFPALASEVAIDAIDPDLTGWLDSEQTIVEINQGNGQRYYQFSTNPFTAGKTRLGKVIMLTDVTDREQYRRELERQNERLDQFASVVSHDLRNPLNTADGWLELAREECDSDHLDELERLHTRMRTLIEDLLTLAREGETVDTLEPVGLAGIVTDCWESVGTAEATLSIDTDARIRADRSRMRQLLENLIRNAVEHGGADVTITVGALTDEAGFYVEDDGTGIPENQREGVFEPGRSSNAGGTGLGLAIVREIADAHGWTVRLTESPEGGARFEFTGVDLVG